MAYANLLASVSESCVSEFQSSGLSLQASKVVQVSHLIAYWVTVQPLGKILGEAIDGGELISKNINHPFRSPVWHKSESVKIITDKLSIVWQQVIRENGEIPKDDWYRIEIEKVLSIFQHASMANEAIVSFLDINNFDIEKNRRIRIPIELKYEI